MYPKFRTLIALMMSNPVVRILPNGQYYLDVGIPKRYYL